MPLSEIFVLRIASLAISGANEAPPLEPVFGRAGSCLDLQMRQEEGGKAAARAIHQAFHARSSATRTAANGRK